MQREVNKITVTPRETVLLKETLLYNYSPNSLYKNKFLIFIVRVSKP